MAQDGRNWLHEANWPRTWSHSAHSVQWWLNDQDGQNEFCRADYFMLTRGEAYVDQGQQHYEEQQRQRSIAALKRRAAALGFAVTPTPVPV